MTRSVWQGVTSRVASTAARLRVDVPFAVGDAVLVLISYLSALLLRFDGAPPAGVWERGRGFLLVAVVVQMVAFAAFHLYGQLWHHASVQEARNLLGAATGTVATLALLNGLLDPQPLPVSVVVMGSTLASGLSGLFRFQSRLFAHHRPVHSRSVPTIVIGAGEAGSAIVRELRANAAGDLTPVAVLDDDVRKHGRSLHGVRVVGRIDDLPMVAAQTGARLGVLAMPSADSHVVRRAATAAEGVGLPLKIVPSVGELVGGQVRVQDVRDLNIEDLLGRQEIHTDLDAVRRLLAGRSVLVTGAGGSIGSELARQIAGARPGLLVLLDHDETHLHDLAVELDDESVQVLADVRDGEAVRHVFEAYRPDIVFHAAAHKHVPILEDHPSEAVRTNVHGTQVLVEAARRHGTSHFVLISTDKAVQPSSAMGASKALAERIVLSAGTADRAFCAVRFGNVLGSRGSVVPTFARQLKRGGPLTVTDPRMTRFFMSITEAVQLVLQAAVLARGPDVFMLEMGEPMQIRELAERMIRLSGRQVGTDVEIRITGVRQGEKLAEELCAPNEHTVLTEHPSILRVLRPTASVDPSELARLNALAVGRRDREARDLLFTLVTSEAPVDATVIDIREPAPTGEPAGSPSIPQRSP